MMRINKKLKDDDRWSIDKVINSLVLSNKYIEEGLLADQKLQESGDEVEDSKYFSSKTVCIELKAKTLNKNLLSYLRAHCLLFYNGKDIANLRVTEPTDIEYELMILDAYQKVLKLYIENNLERFNLKNTNDL